MRRENYSLLTDKRRLELENQMLKATSDGGEQRTRERSHYEDEIRNRDNQVLDAKDKLMKREQENALLFTKCKGLESQV